MSGRTLPRLKYFLPKCIGLFRAKDRKRCFAIDPHRETRKTFDEVPNIRPELVREGILKQAFIIHHFSHMKNMVLDDLADVADPTIQDLFLCHTEGAQMPFWNILLILNLIFEPP